MSEVKLYLIAILPQKEIGEQVISFQTEFAERFKSSRALRPPPHITLQAPFKMLITTEQSFINILSRFFEAYSSFLLELKNFGCFPKNRNPVVFISPVHNEAMNLLHRDLMLFLRKLSFDEEQTSLKFHPHMTVAYRDLTPYHFKQAWAEFCNRSYEASFLVNKIWLLRHEGRWMPIHGFPLRASS
jgi:2'-5' RNA ligase